MVSVGGGSWGLQIGVGGVALVMLVMNDQGFQHLLSSQFQLRGEGSVAAGPVGRHASAGTDLKGPAIGRQGSIADLRLGRS